MAIVTSRARPIRSAIHPPHTHPAAPTAMVTPACTLPKSDAAAAAGSAPAAIPTASPAPRASALAARNAGSHVHIAYSSHMWPRYPPTASRVSRCRATSPASRQENGRRGNGNGPSWYARAISAAAASEPPETVQTTARHGTSASAPTRYGIAFPIVSAPIRMPMARPRPDRNHVAAIFIAGGYTPARNTPVAKRDASAGPNPGTTVSAALDSGRAAPHRPRPASVRSPRRAG